MHILRGIRIMMVRLITRATRHYELRATCFPRGGVPTEWVQRKLTTSFKGGAVSLPEAIFDSGVFSKCCIVGLLSHKEGI